MIDSIVVLNMITEFATEDDPFSITQDDGYFVIALGEIKHFLPALTEKALLEAMTTIRARVYVKRGWITT